MFSSETRSLFEDSKMKSLALYMLACRCCLGSSSILPDTTYRLETASTGRFLRWKGPGQTLAVAGSAQEAQQTWIFKPGTEGAFKICIPDGDCLTGAHSRGGAVTAEPEASLNRQHWFVDQTEGETIYRITNFASGFCLEAVDEEAPGDDPDPDVRYYDATHSWGWVDQVANASTTRQLWHAAPVRAAPVDGWTIAGGGWVPAQPKNVVLQLGEVPVEQILYSLSKNGVVVGSGELNTSDNLWGMNYFSVDLTHIAAQEGTYSISAAGHTSSFVVDGDALKAPKGENDALSAAVMMAGFWAANHYYTDGQQLHVGHIGQTDTDVTNGSDTFFLEPYGWFDANSRDSKTARTATALQWMAYACSTWPLGSENSAALLNEIIYVLNYYKIHQQDDGSWPMGKIRESTSPRKHYFWVVDKDGGAVAKSSRAVAVVAQALAAAGRDDDAAIALQLARAGYIYADTHQSATDFHTGVPETFSGGTADLLGAAAELFIATGESQYSDDVADLLANATVADGSFRRTSGQPFPRETVFSNENVAALSRFTRSAAPTHTINLAIVLVDTWASRWLSTTRSAHGVPSTLVKSMKYGQMGNAAGLAAALMHYATAVSKTLVAEDARATASSIYGWLTGCNPFASSFVQGVGAEAGVVSFFLRSFADGVGSVLPGFHIDNDKLAIKFSTYHAGEGTVIGTAPLLDLLAKLDQNFGLVV